MFDANPRRALLAIAAFLALLGGACGAQPDAPDLRIPQGADDSQPGELSTGLTPIPAGTALPRGQTAPPQDDAGNAVGPTGTAAAEESE